MKRKILVNIPGGINITSFNLDNGFNLGPFLFSTMCVGILVWVGFCRPSQSDAISFRYIIIIWFYSGNVHLKINEIVLPRLIDNTFTSFVPSSVRPFIPLFVPFFV